MSRLVVHSKRIFTEDNVVALPSASSSSHRIVLYLTEHFVDTVAAEQNARREAKRCDFMARHNKCVPHLLGLGLSSSSSSCKIPGGWVMKHKGQIKGISVIAVLTSSVYHTDHPPPPFLVHKPCACCNATATRK